MENKEMYLVSKRTKDAILLRGLAQNSQLYGERNDKKKTTPVI